MSTQPAHHSERLRDRLAGQHLLVTGATGFLAKVFVEKLLRSVDTIGGIHLLVRPKPDGTPPIRRVWQTVLSSSVFDRLRAALGDGFNRLCEEKIHVVDGDLTKERMGLDRSSYEQLTRTITLVANSAATVTFDERLDLAVELNTLGPTRLLQFAKDAGNIPFLHVSTCYVCGVRTGVVVEDMSAPEAARESLPRQSSTGVFDFDALVDSMLGEAAELRHRFAADQEACRRQLIEAGMARARASGWNDTYTFTKWIGEQLLARDRGDVPLAIFRPAIIEGSYDEPTPGWIDGLRMADPIIVAHGRGKLAEFPANKDIPLDLIPVDFVANAMIATLPHKRQHPPKSGLHEPQGENGQEARDVVEGRPNMTGPTAGGLTVVQCGSSDRNPMMIREISPALYKAFRKRPMNDDEGRPIYPAPLRLVDIELFQNKWERRKRYLLQLQRLIKAVSPRGRRLRRINATLRQVEQLLYFAKIYSPYTHLNTRFADDTLRAAGERLHPDDRVLFPFDVDRVDWEDYLVNRHVPGLRSFVLGTGGEPSGRLRAEIDLSSGERSSASDALQAANLFDVFQRAARRYRQKSALQIRRNNRWLRYTYDEALQATGTIMLRFVERGLTRGDRIAICAENGPEWGLTYLAAMRAGLTAIPIDPELPAREVWASARFASARLMCAGGKTYDALCAAKHDTDVEVVKLREPFIPAPGASRDRLPDPVPLDDSAIASILFTSGTTVLPKAVPLTHRNLIANARALVQVHPVNASDELLSVLPMYHAFEFTAGFLVPVVSGATITYVEQLKGAEIMSAMQATGTTVMLVVPRLLRLFNDSIENNVANGGLLTRIGFRMLRLLSELSGRRLARPLFRSVRKKFGGHLGMFVCGGSRLDPELFHAFERMGFKVFEGYGLTETAPVLTVNPPGDSRPGSVGRPLPNVELEIRNATLDGIGEVWVRGPNIMGGYLGNDEATREVVQGGWFRTGDLGRLDEDGYLYLTGRSKDLIITDAGKNVYPDEIEALYRDLPYVKEMCVFGMTAPDGVGDAVHAVIVIDREAAPDMDRSSIEREVRLAAEEIGDTLPQHQRISSFHFWDRELPRTSTMKAKRGLIRDIVTSESVAEAGDAVARKERTLDDEAMPASPNEDAWLALRDILARQSKTPPSSIRPTMHLQLDLGIDSIGRLELIGTVESCFNMRIDNEPGAGVARVADLLKLIGPRKPSGARPSEARSATIGAWQRRLETDGKRENGAAFDGRIPGSLMPVRWLVRGTVSALMHSYVRVRAHGVENVPDQGPFLLAANHSSHLDTPSVLTALGGKRRVWTAGAEDYFFGTRLRRLVFGQLLDTIPFDRHSDGVTGLRRCGKALQLGDGLLLFPEGTRSITGEIQPFKIGIAVLAIERGVPIVPVYIRRAHDLMPKGSRFARPGLVTVSFGEPIHPPARKEVADYYAAFQDVTRRVEQAVRALAEGVPA